MTRFYAVIVRNDGQTAFGTFADVNEAESYYMRHVEDYNVHVFGDINGAYYLAVYTQKAVKQ